MKSVNAVIKLEVPEYQIGEPVTIFFKDTMQKSGICSREQEFSEIEIEYGGTTWWYVCEECRGSVDRDDNFCRHCGRTFVDSVKK